MSTREKESKLEKLKQFFRGSKTNSAVFKNRADLIITSEIEAEISPSSNINQRVKGLKDLGEIMVYNRLEEYGVEKLWTLIQDLFDKDVDVEYRHTALLFLKILIQSQYDKLGIMRCRIFQFIKAHDIAEDRAIMFEILQQLTQNGRDIQQFEEHFGEFISHWLPSVAGAGKVSEFLELIVDFIKCNAAYVDECDIMQIVEFSSFLCCWSTDQQIVKNSLIVLDTIVCYSELPCEALKDFTAALCRKVNAEECTNACWRIMRNLLGTHLGHSTLFVLCKYLEDPGVLNDFNLLRGAVFYLNMGLWSDKKVPNLKCTPTSVLPSLQKVLDCNCPMVFYEVMYSVERLIMRIGGELYEASWSVILEILHKIILYLNGNPQTEEHLRINEKFQNSLNSIEKLIELGQFHGSCERVFKIIGMSSNQRPESSILQLISYEAQFIQPTTYEWLTRLVALVDKYFKLETRPNIRIKIVEVVSMVVSKYRYIYEDELLEKVILTNLQPMENETELCVRNAVAQLLLSVSTECDSKKCIDVLSILKKILNRPYDQNLTDLSNEGDILDIKTVAAGLVRIFHIKLHQLPSGLALKTYKILLNFLENHYLHFQVLDFNHNVFQIIFEFLMKLRVNRLGKLGLVEPSGPKFSPYVTVDFSGSPTPSSGGLTPSLTPSFPTTTPISLNSASKVILSALRFEKDWRIVQLLLLELPKVLENKALVTKMFGNDIGLLADALCAMVTDKSLNLPESLKYTNYKLTRTEFQSLVFPVIAAIASYHNFLDFNQQARFINCLEQGLPSKSAGQCILALTTCILEMRDAMYKMLPEVLINLSKISATVVIAIPILEFLSTLTSLPKVFGSFVGDQYMSVFAIALPYTNPFKYNHYTVSLAHHVIAVWFLKCRLPFRRDFVKFITTGLKSNAIAPFEEGQHSKPDVIVLNEDSTNRKRSSSLTEEGSRRRERNFQQNAARFHELKPPIDEALNTFHKELTETCIDLMARYTYSSCEPRPTRSLIADVLLKGGQSLTWLVGHKIIRVTTSGCSQKPMKNNLCDRCWNQCRLSEDENKRDETMDEPLSGDTSGSIDIDGEKIFPDEAKVGKDQCACWCQGWAEVHVRRATGDMSWIVRLQNETHNLPDFPVSDVATIFLSSSQPSTKDISLGSLEEPPEDAPSSSHSGILTISTTGSPQPASHPVSIPGSPASRQNSRESAEDDDLEAFNDKTRNPVRRSNSSPEMSASWKSPFLKDKEKLSGEESPKMLQRVSCEAIPEEMTPPETQPVLTKPPPSGGCKKSLRVDIGLSVDVAAAQRASRGVRAPLSSGAGLESSDEPSQLPVRDRSRTISVMSPIRKSRYEMELSAKSKPHSPRSKETPRSGISPSFVFLQLYHSAYSGRHEEKPILISNDSAMQRGLNALDFIPPFETHKVGVLYIGPGQVNNETEILRNEFGSLRYTLFLHNLGTLISLKDADPLTTFLGGLDKSGVDGKYAYIWQDDIIQMIFHVATLMPNKESDPNCNTKKCHIGNNFVTIVYNESGEDYNIQTSKGQFNYANIIIQPLDLGSNRVTVKVREELTELIGHSEPKIVSDDNLPLLARQLALHANLASQVSRSLSTKNGDPYASNWLERLRKIKRMKGKVIQLVGAEQSGHHLPANSNLRKRDEFLDDFTEYA